jgi:uncharacterized protein (DUF488 family)
VYTFQCTNLLYYPLFLYPQRPTDAMRFIMKTKSLYTIGHGARKERDFLALLQCYGIEILMDVRSQPYSKFHPQFNQNNLHAFLERHDIRYIFMGDTLGGRPKDKSCYNEEGSIDYDIVKTKGFFRRGIDILKSICDSEHKVAVMCSESNPCDCHRTKLIGKVLNTEEITLKHIDAKGKLKDHTTVLNEMNKGLSCTDLFGNGIKVVTGQFYL